MFGWVWDWGDEINERQREETWDMLRAAVKIGAGRAVKTSVAMMQ